MPDKTGEVWVAGGSAGGAEGDTLPRGWPEIGDWPHEVKISQGFPGTVFAQFA
jgi:hypothetical protein